MRDITLFFITLLLTDSACGLCTDGRNVHRICENFTAEFEVTAGHLWISPDDLADLTSCTCRMSTMGTLPSTIILSLCGAGTPSDSPFNFTIASDNKTITDRSDVSIFAATLSDNEDVTLLLVRQGESSQVEAGTQYCFGFATVKDTDKISITCTASFLPGPETPETPPEESETSLGVILGPTLTVFILADIAIIGVVYYIMKRRMKTQARWRPRIEHTVTHMKDDSVASDKRGHGGNNYVGIRSKTHADGRQEQLLGEEYEDVGRPVSQDIKLDIPLPQKKTKPWFFFRKGRSSVYSRGKDVQPTEEYEDVQASTVPAAKTNVMQSARNFQPESYENFNKAGEQFGRKKNQSKKIDVRVGKPVDPRVDDRSRKDLQTPTNDDWTPADAYEEVEMTTNKTANVTKVNEGFVPKESYETMGDLKSAIEKRQKKQLQTKAGAGAGANVDGNQRPTECYEDMNPPVKTVSDKLKTDRKKLPIAAKPHSFRNPGSQGEMPNTTFDNENWSRQQPKPNDGSRKRYQPNPSTQGTEKQEFRPSETYDNVEMFAKKPTSRVRGISEKQADTKPPPPQRPRTKTEPPHPSEAYDNFGPIAEQRRLARSQSRKASVRRT